MTTSAPPTNPMSGPAGPELADHVSQGGKLATVISLSAFLFSGLSFYESVLKQADLDVFVPPVIHYARDGGGDIDVLAIPITIANDGASTGTVLSMELSVERLEEKADPKKKTFYSAYVGEHPRDSQAIRKSFAPISIPGRGTYTETIRFYPQGNPLPKLVTDRGDYKLTLSLSVAKPAQSGLLSSVFRVSDPAPITFVRTLPYITEQGLGHRRDTIAMYAKDWKPTTSAGK